MDNSTSTVHCLHCGTLWPEGDDKKGNGKKAPIGLKRDPLGRELITVVRHAIDEVERKNYEGRLEGILAQHLCNAVVRHVLAWYFQIHSKLERILKDAIDEDDKKKALEDEHKNKRNC